MRKAALFSLLLAVPGAGQGSATERPEPVVFGIGYAYVPGEAMVPGPGIVVPAGSGLVYWNLNTFTSHTITSVANTDTGAPLFDSGDVRGMQRGQVRGVASLAPATYAFYCTQHPGFMSGNVTLVGGPS